MAKKLDNSTFDRKCWLRRRVMQETGPCRVMETHGGSGLIFTRCYRDCPEGIVIEKNEEKAAALVCQRPTWTVFADDSETVIAAGAGAGMPIQILDCDPYGSPWPVINAFFTGDRNFQTMMHVVVNDGLKRNASFGGASKNTHLCTISAQYGDRWVSKNYLEACKMKMNELASIAGYKLVHWHGYYCGKNQAMTHYWAALKR